MTRLTQSVALACGTAGAFVDVSSYANLLDGTSRSWGRQSEFEDTAPGTFSFTLDNSDGRFNPGSTTLATPVTEGMQVCWQLGSRLVAGTILAIEPSFPDAESAWAQVTITCDDMLGTAARHTIDQYRNALFDAAGGFYLWEFTDSVGAPFAAEAFGGSHLTVLSGTPTFGVTDSVISAPSVVALNTADLSTYDNPPPSSALPIGSDTLGSLGFWVSAGPADSARALARPTLVTVPALYVAVESGVAVAGPESGTKVTGPTLDPTREHYIVGSTTTAFVAGEWTFEYELWVDGVSYGTIAWVPGSPITSLTDANRTPYRFEIRGNTGTVYAYRMAYSRTPALEYTAITSTEAERLTGLLTGPGLDLDTLPSSLSLAPLGELGTAESSILDSANDVIRAEQGAIYSTTTGTLTAPVEKITVRARDRVVAVDCTFNVETEASGGTDFIRDITNMVQTITVDGTDTSVTYTDTTLADRVGSKNASESVPFRDSTDLYAWGTDRVFRGANVALRAASLTIDAFTTPTDRSADLLALIPGDRIQATGLPTSLGFTTWDGWLLGVEEQHSLTEHTFTLYLQPVLPDPIILDTDYLTAGGNLSLTSNITNSATSISVTSSDGSLFTTGADLPQKIRVESECMNVTAVSGASSPQTFTVTRGVTDPVTGLATTAASHLAAVTLELADYNVLAF